MFSPRFIFSTNMSIYIFSPTRVYFLPDLYFQQTRVYIFSPQHEYIFSPIYIFNQHEYIYFLPHLYFQPTPPSPDRFTQMLKTGICSFRHLLDQSLEVIFQWSTSRECFIDFSTHKVTSCGPLFCLS